MDSKIPYYVSMLMFSSDRTKVALITKKRPTFLEGKLCPVGGHVDDDETLANAAMREFEEETGVKTEASDWLDYAVCRGPDWQMHCFVSYDDQVFNCHTTTDEHVSIHEVGDLLAAIVAKPDIASSDLIALIGLALQAGIRDGLASITYA
jgi:8-oxo-dGTP diphosphatase